MCTATEYHNEALDVQVEHVQYLPYLAHALKHVPFFISVPHGGDDAVASNLIESFLQNAFAAPFFASARNAGDVY